MVVFHISLIFPSFSCLNLFQKSTFWDKWHRLLQARCPSYNAKDEKQSLNVLSLSWNYQENGIIFLMSNTFHSAPQCSPVSMMVKRLNKDDSSNIPAGWPAVCFIRCISAHASFPVTILSTNFRTSRFACWQTQKCTDLDKNTNYNEITAYCSGAKTDELVTSEVNGNRWLRELGLWNP